MQAPPGNRPPSQRSQRSQRFQRFQQRVYRSLAGRRLECELIRVQETDLAVYSDTPAPSPAVGERVKQIVFEQRGYIEAYIQRFPEFGTTLMPWPEDPMAPAIVGEMIWAGALAGVGPMAAVAGALAQAVGVAVLASAGEVVVENGGDVFVHTRCAAAIALFAGDSPLSLKFGLQLDSTTMPWGICTSSGRVGHSLSFGCADAVCVISKSCALADAAATAIANRVTSVKAIEAAISWGATLAGVEGIVIIVSDQLGAWGKLDLIPL